MVEAVSAYEFAGSEAHTRRTYSRFLHHFDHCRRVVDVASGRGIFLQLLQERGIDAVGVDRSPEALSECLARGLSNVVRADAIEYLRDHRGEFDGLFCAHLVEHLAPDSVTELLMAAFEALRPGGKAVFVTPNTLDVGIMTHLYWLDLTHIRPYPIPLFARICVLAGFSEVEGGSVGSWLGLKREPVRALLRLVSRGRLASENGYVACRRP